MIVAEFRPDDEYCSASYQIALKHMECKLSFTTSQMCLLRNERILDYDEVRIVTNGHTTVLRNDKEEHRWLCDDTTRELRHGHNLLGLWQGGEFDVWEDAEVKCCRCLWYDPIIHSCGRIDCEAGNYVSYVFDDCWCSIEEGAIPMTEEEFNLKWWGHE